MVIDKIQEYLTPTTVKQLQTFLDLSRYQRAFVPHLAHLIHPLYSLVKRGLNWDWAWTSEQAFQGAKCIIKHTQALHALDPARPCELHVHVRQEGSGWGLW